MSKKSTILLVDDEVVNIQVLNGALRSEYNIITAYNGCDAIALVKEHNPDLIILDVMMPNLDGFEVCRIIKSDESFTDMPVIFLTGMDTPEGEMRGLGLGGVDYLAKPVNLDLLRLRVRNYVELKKRSDFVREQRDLLAYKNEKLEEALARVKQLEGVIPICMHCKSIRNDSDSWQQLETYISDHTDALFSHGICPTCFKEHYPDFTKNMVG